MTTDGLARIELVVEVDASASRRGLASRVFDDLAGEPVLRRTVRRLAESNLGAPLVLAHSRDADRVRETLSDVPHRLHVHEERDIDSRPVLRRARRWGKEGWRGGLADAFAFCEAGNPRALERVFEIDDDTDHIALISGEAALVSPELVSEIIEHSRRARPALALSTAPPGLAADVVSKSVNRELAKHGATIDRVYPFRPGDAVSDPDVHRISYVFDERVTCARLRLFADSTRGETLLRELVGRDVTTAIEIVERIGAGLVAGTEPEEIVVELGADAGGARRRPRADRSAGTGTLPDATWSRVLESVRTRDDALVTLGGGYHDPLLDPRLEARVSELRDAGTFGIHVDTSGARCTPGLAGALVRAGVDVVTIDLGTASEAGNARAYPDLDPWDARVRGADALIDARTAASQRFPLIVVACDFEETSRRDLDDLVDRFHGRADRVLIRTHATPEGTLADGAVASFAPPRRFACVSLSGEMRIEADGSVPRCRFDPSVRHGFGQVGDTASVSDVWTSADAVQVRALHGNRRWADVPGCAACAQWFAW